MRIARIYWLAAGIVCIGAIAAASVHFVHAWQRSILKRPQVSVTVPEGSTIYDIDRILSNTGVLPPGALIAAANESSPDPLEGALFPDTYYFYPGSTVADVLQRFENDFNIKAAPLLATDPRRATDPASAEQDLIIASLIQKEVSNADDMSLVAGIIDKRLAAGMPLDIDATICYIKQMRAADNVSSTTGAGCYPLTAADFRIDSPYNTYKYKGLPPAPIDNPGVNAIEAALHPASSSYWYYLSDPKTGATIYAATLEQQNTNRAKYLK